MERSGGQGWPERRLLLVSYGVLLAVISAVPIGNLLLRDSSKDYPKWFAAGTEARQGGDFYTRKADGTLQFMYPPPAATLLALPSLGGIVFLVVFLVLLNSAAWVTSVSLCARMVTERAPSKRVLLYVLPGACCIVQVWETYLLGQPNLLLLALALGAFACLDARRDAAAGFLIALAVAIKAFPILLVPYLVARRHWRATAWTALFLFVLFLVLPLPLRGWRQNLDDLDTWRSRMLRYDEETIAERPKRSWTTQNQSLVAVANRLLRPVDAEDSESRVTHVNVVSLSFGQVNLAILGASLALGLAYLACLPPAARRTGGSNSIERAMLLLLVLVATPFAFNYFFVWLLFPLTVAVGCFSRASRERRRSSGVWLSAVVLLLGLNLTWFGKAIGVSFWACLVLFAGFARELRTAGAAEGCEPPPCLGSAPFDQGVGQ